MSRRSGESPTSDRSSLTGGDDWRGESGFRPTYADSGKAKIEGPKRTRSVHLKLDPEVFAFFVQETGGKGHLTRMQAVLKAYVEARKG